MKREARRAKRGEKKDAPSSSRTEVETSPAFKARGRHTLMELKGGQQMETFCSYNTLKNRENESEKGRKDKEVRKGFYSEKSEVPFQVERHDREG